MRKLPVVDALTLQLQFTMQFTITISRQQVDLFLKLTIKLYELQFSTVTIKKWPTTYAFLTFVMLLQFQETNNQCSQIVSFYKTYQIPTDSKKTTNSSSGYPMRSIPAIPFTLSVNICTNRSEGLEPSNGKVGCIRKLEIAEHDSY